MGKRDFLMLAQEWEPGRHDVGGWWVSEKLDGMRAFWDGGVSRGVAASEVPYANVAKDARYLTPPVSTGLWTRYGKTIQAPGWWLDALPVGVNLDLELWMGRGRFQDVMSCCKQLVGDARWRDVVGMAIDAPSWSEVLWDGELTGTNWKGVLGAHMMPWVAQRCKATSETGIKLGVTDGAPFTGYGLPDECFQKLRMHHAVSVELGSKLSWWPMPQEKLPRHPDDARERVEAELQRVTAAGGEGLILRRGTGPWLPKRVEWILKCKKLHDMEGTVTGFTWGRRTALGSRHLGRMGALVLRLDSGVRLELSGFTDEERAVRPRDAGIELGVTAHREHLDREGCDASDAWEPVYFKPGTRVTFTYRELTRDGVPKEARYLRRRDETA